MFYKGLFRKFVFEKMNEGKRKKEKGKRIFTAFTSSPLPFP